MIYGLNPIYLVILYLLGAAAVVAIAMALARFVKKLLNSRK